MHFADFFMQSDSQKRNKAIHQGVNNIYTIQWQVYLSTRLGSKLEKNFHVCVRVSVCDQSAVILNTDCHTKGAPCETMFLVAL